MSRAVSFVLLRHFVGLIGQLSQLISLKALFNFFQFVIYMLSYFFIIEISSRIYITITSFICFEICQLVNLILSSTTISLEAINCLLFVILFVFDLIQLSGMLV